MLCMGSTEEYVSGYQIRAVYFEEVLLSPVIINTCTFFFVIYKQYFCEHSVQVFERIFVFISLVFIPRSRIVAPYDNSV